MSKTSLDKDKIKILLVEGVHQNAVDNFKANGYNNIVYFDKALGEEELLKEIKQAHFIGIRSRTQLTKEVIASAEKLVAIGCFCIGTNQVDLDAALELGIPVFNAPYSNTRSVAEVVVAEAVMLMRGIAEKNTACHRGDWIKSAANSYEVRGKTFGIVGYGNIGAQASVLAETMGMKVIYYDVITKLPLGNAKQVGSLEELLSQADIVSLHVPQLESTKWMIGKKQLEVMKKGAHLINYSRGTVVVIEDLAEAIKNGHLGGAAVDVFPKEPKGKGEEFVSPLRELKNVILTPHIGGSTLEAQQNIGTEVSEKLIRYSDTGATLSSVNFPEVVLPAQDNKYRLLHIHKNVPGVLGEINRVLSENKLNIAGQFLRTDNEVGYVVIDVDAAYSDKVLAELKAIENTIRARVLF